MVKKPSKTKAKKTPKKVTKPETVAEPEILEDLEVVMQDAESIDVEVSAELDDLTILDAGEESSELEVDQNIASDEDISGLELADDLGEADIVNADDEQDDIIKTEGLLNPEAEADLDEAVEMEVQEASAQDELSEENLAEQVEEAGAQIGVELGAEVEASDDQPAMVEAVSEFNEEELNIDPVADLESSEASELVEDLEPGAELVSADSVEELAVDEVALDASDLDIPTEDGAEVFETAEEIIPEMNNDLAVAGAEDAIQVQLTARNTSEEMPGFIDKLLENRCQNIVIDASSVERVDTAFVEAMIAGAKLWSSDGYSMNISNPTDALEDSLGLLGVPLSNLEVRDIAK